MRFLPIRIPILYLILGVLLLVSVVPMYFYSNRVVSINRERLKTNEMLLQNTVTRSVAEDIRQRDLSLRMMLQNLANAVKVTSGTNLSNEHVSTPELRALLEQFVSSYDSLAYVTLLNPEARGISAGRVQPDSFLQREFERAFIAARSDLSYTGQPLTLEDSRHGRHTVFVVSYPLFADGRFVGMIGTVVDLQFLVDRLNQLSRSGLITYVIDRQGRLVAGSIPEYVPGQDMRDFEIARNFANQGGVARLSETTEFTHKERGTTQELLGTYSPVPSLQWAVVAQKDQRDAYVSVYEMQTYSRLLALLTILLSLAVSILAARRLTTPLRVLADSSSAIAHGNFSHRVELKSRTEFGELANTFNFMSDEIEKHVRDLKEAADKNRALFMNSIKMIAGAVDERDPYTRGHSDRVTKYSVFIATELGLPEAEIDQIRVAALLHDVGKIGIEDAILKKPGALTREEYEIMKTHTTKAATILRPVAELRNMLPGIELHHESLDGHGYPYGLKGDQIPMMSRVITVADTFDAMTTNRPYQTALELNRVIAQIKSLAGRRYDPKVVDALVHLVECGTIELQKPVILPDDNVESEPTPEVRPEQLPGAAAGIAAVASVSFDADFGRSL